MLCTRNISVASVNAKAGILFRSDTTLSPISASYFSIDFDNGEFTRAASDARIAFEYCLLSHSHSRTRTTLLSQYVATFGALPSPPSASASAPSFFSSQYTKWNRSEVKIPLSSPLPHIFSFPLHNICIPAAAGSFVRSVDDGITQFASYADSNAGMDGVEVFWGLSFRFE